MQSFHKLWKRKKKTTSTSENISSWDGVILSNDWFYEYYASDTNITLSNYWIRSYSLDQALQKEIKIKLLETNIDQYDKITWNSATGLVIGEKDGGVKKALHIQGDSAGELPPGIIDTINIQELKYHYWYY